MLTIILCIGPLARLDRRFLPLLYNRRHFGVLTFLIASTHGWLMIEWFAAQNALPDLLAEMTSTKGYDKFIGFPFKMLGLAALLVLFVMAATSHDFWLAFLTPPVWKALHMLLYAAYGLVVMHVALGIMQYERTAACSADAVWRVRPGVGAASDCGVSRVSGANDGTPLNAEGWIVVGAPNDIPDRAARIVLAPGGERIAVFRDGDEIGALTNLCAHQNGPLGEGRIIDGCVTCPWHGYQYRLADGCAPPPFTERLATYRVRINRGMVEVAPGCAAARNAGLDQAAGRDELKHRQRPRENDMADENWIDVGPAGELSNTPLRRISAGGRDLALVVQGRTVRDRVQHLQPRRRAARRRHAARRLHQLPLAQLEIPPLHRPWRAGLRGGRGPGLHGQGGRRPRAGRHGVGDQADAQAARPASAVAQDRARAGAHSHRRHLDLADGRGQSALLRLRSSAAPRARQQRRGTAPKAR